MTIPATPVRTERARRRRRCLAAGVLTPLVLALALVWLFGSREPVDPTVRFDPSTLGRDLDAYLAGQESDVPDLRPEAAKEIVWAYPASKAKTPLSIVYIHGFSGDRQELRPLPDEVARQLGANLFLTRLSGHGRDLSALAEPSANDWLNDVAEAVAIGRRLGERVVVMSASTGGTLSIWADAVDLMDAVTGLVMISPNFEIADWRAPALTMPFARRIVPLVAGETVDLVLSQPNEDGASTAPFPISALLPMAALVDEVRGLDLGAISTPALFVYSPKDQVVSPLATEAAIRAWGGPSEIFLVEDPGDPLGHLLAGDMFSPGTTAAVAAATIDWIERLPVR